MKKLSHSLEDYMEAAYIFEEKNGFSRVKEIADFLMVKLPAVNKAVKELDKRGFLEHKRYGYIKLTENGKSVAKKIFSVHNNLVELFKLLGFDQKSSFKYGCYMEHIIEEKDKHKIVNLIREVKMMKEKKIWK